MDEEYRGPQRDADGAYDMGSERPYMRRHEEPGRRHPLLRTAVDALIIILVAIFLTWGIRNFVMEPFMVPSGSMQDTIEIGDRVFSEKLTYRFSDMKQGDVVTFADPADASQMLIKRVIARGGQTVDLTDGVVHVDGVALDEPYTEGKPSNPLPTTLPGVDIVYPYTVPAGCLWVMGDNRTNSADSRYFGAIPESSVSGHAFFIYWPFGHVGSLN